VTAKTEKVVLALIDKLPTILASAALIVTAIGSVVGAYAGLKNGTKLDVVHQAVNSARAEAGKVNAVRVRER
jgi:hypothetical protein